MKKVILSLAITALTQSFSIGADAAAPDWPKADPAAVVHWQSLRFGMFIHWGPVSLTGHEISWSRGAQTPIEVYDNLYKQFNPTNFNADEWVSVAKAAGMKYIVLTTKHHDGFCLWDTKQTDYNIMNSPFHRDVVKELAAACKKQGIEFGAYYSVPDWYNTNWPMTSPAGKGKREKSDMDVYEEYLQNQITELINNYGPFITIWNDMPAPYGKRGAATIQLVRSLQPDILINNRTGDGGDYDTPEQKIGKFQMDRPWESCMTVSAHYHWSWGGANDGVKSTAACLDMLIRAAGGDGNVLLDVGPRPDGMIDREQANRLKDIGAWFAKNGESIYGTRGGPWKPTEAIASTRKGNAVYLHMMKMEKGRAELPALPAEIKSATLLNGEKVSAAQKDGRLRLTVPQAAVDAFDTIIKLELDRPAMDLPVIEVASDIKATASNVYQKNADELGPHLAAAAETAAEREARMAWWREARFGMFVHWGLYSGLAGTWDGKSLGSKGGMEWIQRTVKADTDTYAAAALPKFQPKSGFAREWAKLAKEAGCRYLVFTTKHHEGFGLYTSKFGDYNAGAKLHRDLVKEIVEACHAEGLKVGFYHSLIDWHYDQYDYTRAKGLPYPLAGKPSPNGPRDHAKYIDYLHGQVGELMSNYGPVDIIWFDFSNKNFQGDEAWRATDLLKLVRAKQPQIIINDRLYVQPGHDEHKEFTTDRGDFSTPEQRIPATGMPGIDWETCMTLNTTWGYSDHDHAWKSDATLIRNLIDIASKGGNYLLNIGPKGDGSLSPETIKSFQAIGAWMKVNGEAIYGTTASPLAKLDWGRATRKGDTVYLHVFDWPKDGNLVVPLKNKVKVARLLVGKKVKTSVTKSGMTIRLPATAPDAIASVIKLTIVGEPEVIIASTPNTHAATNATVSSPSPERSEGSNAAARVQSFDDRRRSTKLSGTSWTTFDPGAGWNSGTAKSSRAAKDFFEHHDGDAWKTIFSGTKIGDRFQTNFAPVQAQEFRLNILDATEGPTIAEIELGERYGVGLAAEPKLGASRKVPLPDKLPEEVTPLGEIPETGVSFATRDAFLQRLCDAAEKVCRGNVVRYPPPFDMDILIEGSGYTGAWLETQPMGGLMWGKRDLRLARNNQMIFMLNQSPDGQLSDCVKTNWRAFGGLQGYCFPTPAWELYFLLNKDKEYLRRLYVALEGHDRFLWATRDNDTNGCLEALSSSDTGEDGSSRYPDGRKEKDKLPCFHESMDVMSYAYDGEKTLAKISAELDNGQAGYWQMKAETTRRKLIEYLWRREKNACYDRDRNNEFMDVLVHNNLRCMYHGIFTQEMADAFIRHHLLNPEEFWTPMPLVSIAANDPKFKSVSHNNWSGQPQGLTFQRAIRALENYGHYAELTLIGEKLLAAVGKDLIFTQQFDPQTGEPNKPRGGRTSTYGPTALSVLEYIAHLHGVELLPERNQVWFSGLARGEHGFEYKQAWNDRTFALRLSNGRFDGLIDGRKRFTCSANVRVMTDLSGGRFTLVGISPKPQKVTFEAGSVHQTVTVEPNHSYTLDDAGAFVPSRSAPFDYPYSQSSTAAK